MTCVVCVDTLVPKWWFNSPNTLLRRFIRSPVLEYVYPEYNLQVMCAVSVKRSIVKAAVELI